MNQTPMGERAHIGIFGRRNAGKSSLINAITAQDLAVVSPVKGTTTDPVKKSMELLPLGPVVLIDTPGLDDEGELGAQRVKKAFQALRQVDFALVVLEADREVSAANRGASDADREASGTGLAAERELLARLRAAEIPFLVVVNKTDLWRKSEAGGDEEENVSGQMKNLFDTVSRELSVARENIIPVSAAKKTGIDQLKETIAARMKVSEEKPLIRDLLSPGEFVVLVVPIDSAAPKGRLILPQQQVIRDALEAGAVPVVTRETELAKTLESLGKAPALVVTDSQVFGRVAREVPREIPLTSFSILMARYKGDLAVQAAGARAVENLSDGDTVLISEGCTHHRQCGDIGTVKLPAWIRKYTGKDLKFAFTSGTEFPEDLSGYALVVHCGGCMLNAREMRSRIASGGEKGVPITNYGVMIAYLHGIFDRVLEPFADLL